MKTQLRHIAKTGVAKWLPTTTTKLWEQDLLSTGWTKEGNSLIKGGHAFTFEPHGSRTAVSHQRLMEVAQ